MNERVVEHIRSLEHGLESERLSFSASSDMYCLYGHERVVLPLQTFVSSSAKSLLLDRVVI